MLQLNEHCFSTLQSVDAAAARLLESILCPDRCQGRLKVHVLPAHTSHSSASWQAQLPVQTYHCMYSLTVCKSQLGTSRSVPDLSGHSTCTGWGQQAYEPPTCWPSLKSSYVTEKSTHMHDTVLGHLLTQVDLQTVEDLLLQLASGRHCHCQ